MKLIPKLAMTAIPLCIACTGNKNAYTTYADYPVPNAQICEMAYTPSATQFALWSPAADAVKLRLFDQDLGGVPTDSIDLKLGPDGLWTGKIKRDLKGNFYTFEVTQQGQNYGQTPGTFAKAVGRNGQRAAIIDLRDSDPEGWADDRAPQLSSYSDIIIYEMHHRDFSISPNSGIQNRGKFLALTENRALDHLTDLGVTHIHILPSFDYGSVDETRLEDNVYNWGYDPVNYNVPEGSYSTDPADPLCRIREFKQMVQALHAAGLRVVLDVVYNHTFNIEGSPLQRSCPGYYYRQDSEGLYTDASGCGNETASERSMMRKYMTESMVYWAKEYHIDGFRVDLMGIHDIETMNEIRAALDEVDPTIFIYGEGWAAGAPEYPAEELAMKANTQKLSRIAAFSDEYRDSMRGPFSADTEGAFVIGNPGHEAGIRFGIAGAIEAEDANYASKLYGNTPWANEPTQMISYVSCHDDMCLADRILATLPNCSKAEQKRLVKLAETMVLCSQGVPFIFNGDEIMRSKQGVHNSFNSPDSINAIDWNLKNLNRDVYEYVREMIRIRKAHPALHLGSAQLVRENLHFLDIEQPNLVKFTVTDGEETIYVAFNSRRKKAVVELPEGEWKVLAYDGEVSAAGLGTLRQGSVPVPPQSALICVK